MATTDTISKSRIAVKHKDSSMWKKAIAYLESELKESPNEARAIQIKAALHTFRANLERGMPWPAEPATQN